MSYQVLARKWRPQNFAQLVGQEHVVSAISNALDNNRLHHAYLFTGTRGVGKTTIARIFSKSLNCEQGMSSTPCGQCATCIEIDKGNFIDLLEIDAASRTKVEDTRELLDNVQYKPTRAQYKVYLIDEVHMLSKHSFNALLKTLEEPPPHVKFLLATTDPQKLPVTILSRCLQFNLKAMSREQIVGQLSHILEQEMLQYEADALAHLARAANGSMRDALSLTDQAIAQGNGQVTLKIVTDMLGLMDKNQVLKLVKSVLEGNAESALMQLDEMVSQSVDFSALLSEILSLLHQIALTQMVPDVCKLETIAARAIYQLAKQTPAEQIQLMYQIALQGRKDLPFAMDGRSGTEMTLLRMLAFNPQRQFADPGHLQQQTLNATAALQDEAANTLKLESDLNSVSQQTEEQTDELSNSLQSGHDSDIPGQYPNTAVPEDKKIQQPANLSLNKATSDMDEAASVNGQSESDKATQVLTETESDVSTADNVPLSDSEDSPEQRQDEDDYRDFLAYQQQEILQQAGDLLPQSDISTLDSDESNTHNPPVSDGVASGQSLNNTQDLLAIRRELKQQAQQASEKKSDAAETASGPGEEKAVWTPPVATKPNIENVDELPLPAAAQAVSDIERDHGDDTTGVPVPQISTPPTGQFTSPQNEMSADIQDDYNEADDAPVAIDTVSEKNTTGMAKTEVPPWEYAPGTMPYVEQPQSDDLELADAPSLDEDETLLPHQLVAVPVTLEMRPFLSDGIKVTLAEQLDEWSHTIQQTGVGGLTKQLALQSAMQKNGDNVLLTLPEPLEHLNNPTARAQLASVLSALWQQQINLDVELGEPVNTPFAIQQSINQMRQAYAQDVISKDDNVQYFMQQFDAQIIENSIEPR
ncbi:DNA polymerase III subunit gamma/tau [Neptunicella marina]|uniref:DNA-directed DNA polymerase n=1 Tax=Neptunicella marina TaxID=2125989 RepID=A0A8J6J1A6_9ALTE|nr:DNA polymerase III subunit gamma/tau [Neptunicella marina]MBC3767773.1 DNA polymerase III subunit gamma/tau [Neptunicella marina]